MLARVVKLGAQIPFTVPIAVCSAVKWSKRCFGGLADHWTYFKFLQTCVLRVGIVVLDCRARVSGD